MKTYKGNYVEHGKSNNEAYCPELFWGSKNYIWSKVKIFNIAWPWALDKRRSYSVFKRFRSLFIVSSSKPRGSRQEVFLKKVFWPIFQNFQEKICAGVFFWIKL